MKVWCSRGRPRRAARTGGEPESRLGMTIARQQSTTDTARPASLVSLYLLFISLAVWAIAVMVASRSIRCLEAISLLAIAHAVQALTAPKAQRSMHGTCTYPATGSQVIPR